jgi:hypothetical protein
LINPSSVASAQSAGTQVTLTVDVHAPIAPVVELDISLFDHQGNLVASVSGGTTESGGVVTQTLTLPSLTSGQYTVGFRLVDAGHLSTTYGAMSTLAPTLTIT